MLAFPENACKVGDGGMRKSDPGYPQLPRTTAQAANELEGVHTCISLVPHLPQSANVGRHIAQHSRQSAHARMCDRLESWHKHKDTYPSHTVSSIYLFSRE